MEVPVPDAVIVCGLVMKGGEDVLLTGEGGLLYQC